MSKTDRIRREVEMLALTLKAFPASDDEQASQDRQTRRELSKKLAVGYRRCMTLLNGIESDTEIDRETCELLCDIRDRMIRPLRNLFVNDPHARRAFDDVGPHHGPLPIVNRGQIALLESAISRSLEPTAEASDGNRPDATRTATTRREGETAFRVLLCNFCAPCARLFGCGSAALGTDRAHKANLPPTRLSAATRRQSCPDD